MLDDFLASIGLRRPAVEVWACQQLVIVDVDSRIIWCRPGVIEYSPIPGTYWGGQASIYDVGTETPRFVFTLDRIDHQDENSFLGPFFGRRGGRRGGKIYGRDETGELVILYLRQHALNYIVARAAVDASEETRVEDPSYDEDEDAYSPQ